MRLVIDCNLMAALPELTSRASLKLAEIEEFRAPGVQRPLAA
jgi:hypothetical protein